MRKIQIAHSEWFQEDRIAQTYRLYRQGNLPSSVAGWMLVVPLKHELRAIFGSDAAAVRYLATNLLYGWVLRQYNRLRRLYCWLPWIIAFLWTDAWGVCRILRHGRVPWVWMWGRRESPEPIRCEECGWAGARRWAVHTYSGCGEDDVEPTDECPVCGAEV